ncbi:MAG: tRNA (adenosine(37)-N6)-threonylcarbamoyltransferase complex dimerization subunit type 1 TsaB [Cyclobacteriaceae bacterium]|nr:tRNA (adenosine(37)-N6)-threonylcarbamoyltransferase complex dimerization subunit type 1 TsaB [Cyclobacteriaceae bacterium]MCH8516594.1 tRNA (adenosine(37)-N6)-threonylcarbamoyltransferase complex dimerization subunit type 1 TsaB [Cyclobacteriaceae bacterium]
MGHYLISIETSTSVCSVSLLSEGEILAEQNLFLDKSHSSNLMPIIRHLMAYANLEMNQLSAVAVSQGPGSYTGLRIGVSTAKGICYALDLPLIAVDTLQAMAYPVIKSKNWDKSTLFIPMIDARRMEVYSAVFSSQGEKIEEVSPVILDEFSYQKYANRPLVFFGNGAKKAESLLIANLPQVELLYHVQASSIGVGKLAYQKFLDKDFVDLAYFEPFYLKAYQAGKPKKRR